MAEIIYGSLTYKNNSYPFMLDGRRVYIVGKAWDYFDDYKDADYEETIMGTTSANRQIMFLRCKFERSLFQQKIWFSPIGYILSCNNIGEPYDFTFEMLSFYADAINSFYPPKLAMETACDEDNWNGSMMIGFKPFNETEISFNYKDSKCRINISRFVSYQTFNTDVGKVNSHFSFEFENTRYGIELLQYWLALFDFISFINYGTDITFDSVTLGKRRTDGLFEHCADAFIFSNREEYTQRNPQNAVTVEDIPKDKLGSMFTKIASLRGNDNRLPFYFPDVFRSRYRIDATQWFITAMNFDGLFASSFPDFKQNHNEHFQTAKSEALNALNKVDKSAFSKKVSKYFNDCCDQINRYEGLLEEKLNFIVKTYHNPLEDILNSNLKKYNTQISDYGKIYSKYRNKIAHGDVQPLSNDEIAVYVVLQAAVYFLLLKDIDLDGDTLKTIVNKLFLL